LILAQVFMAEFSIQIGDLEAFLMRASFAKKSEALKSVEAPQGRAPSPNVHDLAPTRFSWSAFASAFASISATDSASFDRSLQDHFYAFSQQAWAP
jgi:hypothetical protein